MDQKKSFGPIIGIIVIIAVVLVGGFYFWHSKVSRNGDTARNSMQAQTVAPVSKSDDVDTLSAELEASSSAPDLSGLDNI